MKKLIICPATMAVLLLGLSGVAMAAYHIADDATGGDCTQIGVWDAGTKTCTLTGDIYDGINIDSDNIILNGNGHSANRIDTSYADGVTIDGRTGVTVKNLILNNL